mgnify:CR=1 FL=1
MYPFARCSGHVTTIYGTLVKFVVVQLLEKGYVSRGFLGISPVNLSPGLANRLGVPVTSGVAVAGTVPGSAAAKEETR